MPLIPCTNVNESWATSNTNTAKTDCPRFRPNICLRHKRRLLALSLSAGPKASMLFPRHSRRAVAHCRYLQYNTYSTYLQCQRGLYSTVLACCPPPPLRRSLTDKHRAGTAHARHVHTNQTLHAATNICQLLPSRSTHSEEHKRFILTRRHHLRHCQIDKMKSKLQNKHEYNNHGHHQTTERLHVRAVAPSKPTPLLHANIKPGMHTPKHLARLETKDR